MVQLILSIKEVVVQHIEVLHIQAARLFGLVFVLSSSNVPLELDPWQLPSPFAVVFMANSLVQSKAVSEASTECVIKILTTSIMWFNIVTICSEFLAYVTAAVSGEIVYYLIQNKY